MAYEQEVRRIVLRVMLGFLAHGIEVVDRKRLIDGLTQAMFRGLTRSDWENTIRELVEGKHLENRENTLLLETAGVISAMGIQLSQDVTDQLLTVFPELAS